MCSQGAWRSFLDEALSSWCGTLLAALSLLWTLSENASSLIKTDRRDWSPLMDSVLRKCFYWLLLWEMELKKVSSLKLHKRIVNNYILATKTTQKSKMSSAQLLFHTKWITHQCLEATFGITYIILPLNLVLILLPAQCCRCGYQARAEIKRQRSNCPPYCSTATWGAFVVPRQQGNHSGTGAFHSPWSSRRFYEAKLFESITQLAGMVRIETCILGKIEQHK